MKYLVALLVAASSAAGQADAQIANGTFEAGNLSGWQSYTRSGSDDGSLGGVGVITSSLSSAPSEAGEGTAYLQAGAQDDYQRLWQDFTLGSVGGTLSSLIKWEGHDSISYDAVYNDDGYMRIGLLNEVGNVISWTGLWQGSVAKYGNATGGDTGSSNWEQVTYSFADGGRYRVEFGIRNVLDDMQASVMYVDNVVISEPVPEADSLAMMTVGLVVVGAISRRRSHRGVVAL